MVILINRNIREYHLFLFIQIIKNCAIEYGKSEIIICINNIITLKTNLFRFL